MALIESGKYTGLKTFSDQSGARRGVFKALYITGQSRSGEDVGKMQVIKEWENNASSPELLINNATSVNFIIMFIKKTRFNKVDGKLLCSSFNDTAGSISTSGRTCPKSSDRSGFCETCRFQIIIAGALLDGKGKPMKDDDGKTYLVYFRCNGMKYMPAQEYINSFEELACDLSPLSDDPTMEVQLITPRRFVTQAIVGKVPSNHGEKNVFQFKAAKRIPDESVVKIMDDSQKYMKDFEAQFDLSNGVTPDAPVEDVKEPAGVPFDAAEEFPEDAADKETPEAAETKTDDKADDLDLTDFDLGI